MPGEVVLRSVGYLRLHMSHSFSKAAYMRGTWSSSHVAQSVRGEHDVGAWECGGVGPDGVLLLFGKPARRRVVERDAGKAGASSHRPRRRASETVTPGTEVDIPPRLFGTVHGPGQGEPPSTTRESSLISRSCVKKRRGWLSRTREVGFSDEC